MARHLPIDLTTRPSDNSAAAFSQLRTSLIKVLRNSPESREPICDALELIEVLQQRLDSGKQNPDASPPPAARESQSPQEYVVQETPDGPFLAERRPSGAQPFRCPKPTYHAAAQLLARGTDPLHFDDLLAQLNQAMGERQADYRLRVCLRCWLHHKLVQRFRTRYRATDPTTFADRAARLWETLAAAHSPGSVS
jgi:hypothetical protein